MKDSYLQLKTANRSHGSTRGCHLDKQLVRLLDDQPQLALTKVKKLIEKAQNDAELWEFAGRAHHKLGEALLNKSDSGRVSL